MILTDLKLRGLLINYINSVYLNMCKANTLN